MRLTISLLCITTALAVHGQRVLHYTGTSGFDHGTRDASFVLFTTIADELGIEIVDAPNTAAFSSPPELAQYDAVIFSNTSGYLLLYGSQRTIFEEWVNNGGHLMGIHSASDTYRHSTANGDDTGVWDFYAELLGASVQHDPNHVDGTPAYTMHRIGTHPSTSNLPDPWLKNEEYYYWEGGYYNPENIVVLEVEETTGPNGQVNTYDAPRPMSWYRELPTGSRVFYTALGHDISNYTSDELFRAHVRDALSWLLGLSTGIQHHDVDSRPSIFPNPASDELRVLLPNELIGTTMTVTDATGRVVCAARVDRSPMRIDVHTWATGIYVLRIGDREHARVDVMR